MLRRLSTGYWLDTLLLTALAGSFFIGHLSFQYNFDGTVFAFRVEKAVVAGGVWELFHPRHLLYEPLGYLVYKSAYLLGTGLRSIIWLEMLDALFGALAVALFHRLMLGICCDRVISAGACMCLAFSFGFWFFSVEPEVYVPGVFFLLLCFWLLLWCIKSGRGRVFSAVVLGAASALSAANHVVNGLFIIVIFFGLLLYLPGRGDSGGDKKGINLFAAISAVLVFSVILGVLYYVVAANSGLAQETGAARWFLGLADPRTPYGYTKSYWFFNARAPGYWLEGMKSLVLAAGSHLLVKGTLLKCVYYASIVIIFFMCFLYIIRLILLRGREKGVQPLLWLWFAPYALFSMAWEPRNFEIKLFLLAPFYMLLFSGLKDQGGKGRALRFVPLILAGLLFVFNYFGSILPGSDKSSNLDLSRAEFIMENTEPEAVVCLAGVSRGYNIGKIYIPYFSGRRTFVMDWMIQRMISDKGTLALDVRPGSYVLEELVKSGPALEELASNHGLEAAVISKAFLERNPVLVSRHDDDFALYRLSDD